MSASSYNELAAHHGHDIQVVIYGGDANAAVECETCHIVLLDFDRVAETTRAADHAALLALAERHHLADRDLEDAGLDAAFAAAGTAVDKRGLSRQLAYLLGQEGAEGTRHTIEEAARTRRRR